MSGAEANTKRGCFYVAICRHCQERPDGDGEECAITAEKAQEWALEHAQWWLSPQGLLYCEYCRPPEDGGCDMSVPEDTPTIPKHVVWLCAGCDDCEPQDGSEPSRYPCDNIASANGADVFECGPILDLLYRAMVEIGTDAEGDPPRISHEIAALLRANGRLA